MNYSNGFRARMVQRMARPDRISATMLAEKVGVSQNTLSRWLREASEEEKREREREESGEKCNRYRIASNAP